MIDSTIVSEKFISYNDNVGSTEVQVARFDHDNPPLTISVDISQLSYVRNYDIPEPEGWFDRLRDGLANIKDSGKSATEAQENMAQHKDRLVKNAGNMRTFYNPEATKALDTVAKAITTNPSLLLQLTSRLRGVNTSELVDRQLGHSMLRALVNRDSINNYFLMIRRWQFDNQKQLDVEQHLAIGIDADHANKLANLGGNDQTTPEVIKSSLLNGPKAPIYFIQETQARGDSRVLFLSGVLLNSSIWSPVTQAVFNGLNLSDIAQADIGRADKTIYTLVMDNIKTLRDPNHHVDHISANITR